MEIYGDAMMASIIKMPSDLDNPDVEEISSGQQAIVASIEALKKHEAMIKARRARERSRFSEPRNAETPDGAAWTYTIVDDEYLRILKCETACETLVIPSEIDGLPVLELGAQACAFLAAVREIICAEAIEYIGDNVFRGCRNLERLVFPANITRFNATWLAQCSKLREVILPAMLSTFDAGVFNAENIEVLTLGIATQFVEPGAFAKSKLNELHIPSQNPYLKTDGTNIFCKDGTELIAVAVPCTSFDFPHGCRHIASKAFAACPKLESISFSDSLETIGAHAFARTALQSISTPGTLKIIERRAFYRCKNLETVTLNEGLTSIEDEVFAGTALKKLLLPASLESVGRNAFSGTGLTFAADRGSCTVASCGKLHFDKNAVLYRESDERRGKELLCAMGSVPMQYKIENGTSAIAPEAFANCDDLREVILCEGLTLIGRGAFRSCKNLSRADFPETLRTVEDEAFLNTALENIYIPASLTHIGVRALVSTYAHEGEGMPSLNSIRVNPNSSHFYFTGGLLCERMPGGTSRVVLFDDKRETVVIPSEVTEICPYAFSGALNLHDLTLTTRITHIGTRGFNFNCLVEYLHVDFAEPIEGHSELDLRFPRTLRSVRELTRSLNTSPNIDPERILARYDTCVVNMHDYDAKNSDPVDLYAQVTRIIERLKNPFFLAESTRNMYVSIMKNNIEEMCVAVARHDDRAVIDDLIDLGFLTRENILGVIDCVGRLQDAAMTGYLLETKRRLFDSDGIDFEL